METGHAYVRGEKIGRGKEETLATIKHDPDEERDRKGATSGPSVMTLSTPRSPPSATSACFLEAHKEAVSPSFPIRTRHPGGVSRSKIGGLFLLLLVFLRLGLYVFL